MTKPSLNTSCEFFPPKTEAGAEQLYAITNALSKYQPNFFSVTFGADGSTRDGTLEAVKALQQRGDIPVAPHLSCMGMTREALAETLDEYKAMGVRRIVALRGDMPSGMGHTGQLRYAYELVELIRAHSGDHFHIDVAAYPEIHPQAKCAHSDILNLKRKVDAGANSAITQYFFNADAYFHYLEECAKEGIEIPITPGIMPITQYSRLARFSEMCGAEIPRWMRKKMEAYGDDVEAVQAFGFEVVAKLCETLVAGGAPGLHFYTLNKVEATEKLLGELVERPILIMKEKLSRVR